LLNRTFCGLLLCVAALSGGPAFAIKIGGVALAPLMQSLARLASPAVRGREHERTYPTVIAGRVLARPGDP